MMRSQCGPLASSVIEDFDCLFPFSVRSCRCGLSTWTALFGEGVPTRTGKPWRSDAQPQGVPMSLLDLHSWSWVWPNFVWPKLVVPLGVCVCPLPHGCGIVSTCFQCFFHLCSSLFAFSQCKKFDISNWNKYKHVCSICFYGCWESISKLQMVSII